MFGITKRQFTYYRLTWVKHDLPAGLSVFLVALPLCLGIALASGAPLYSGILSGIIGGIVIGFISGSSLSVSGPAAGLTSLIAVAIVTAGDYRVFLLSVIIAGLFQVLLGLFKLGAIANYFPSAVIKGMLAAIGIILISKQIPYALGYAKADFWNHTFTHLFTDNEQNAFFKQFNLNTSRKAIILTVISLIVYFIANKGWLKKIGFIPVSLLVVIIGILFNVFIQQLWPNSTLKALQLVDIPNNILGELQFPNFKALFSSALIWQNGIIIGLVATLETLLCIEAVDKLDKHNRITPVNRELVAQGIGNMSCGLLGAIPVTSVIVRSAANVYAGGKTKLSAITHGLFLIISVLVFPFVINLIPYASLSAILLVTGYNLAKPKLFINMWQQGLKQFLPFVITIICILATDLLKGVSIGLLISIYFIIQNNFQIEYHITKLKKHDTEEYLIKLNSNVSFLNKVQLRKTLDAIPPYSVLTIDGVHSRFIDYDVLEIISEFKNKAHDKHIELHLINIPEVALTSAH